MTALVTGASGFVGSHLVEELLARGHPVRCLVRPTSDLQWLRGLKVEWTRGDLDDPVALRRAVDGVGSVYHLAALTMASSAQAFRRVNVDGTQRLLEAASQAVERPRVVYVSSIAAVGPSRDGQPRIEVEPSGPVSAYGVSKAEAETQVRAFSRELSVSIVRPPVVYGPRDRNLLPLFRLASRGILPRLGRRQDLYSVIHVRDLVRGIAAVGNRGHPLTPGAPGAGIYCLADDGPYDWATIAGAIGTTLGRRVRIVPLPVWLLHVAATAEAVGHRLGRPLILSRDKVRESAAGSWICQSTYARRHLGFAPEYGLMRGFADTARWYRDHGWL